MRARRIVWRNKPYTGKLLAAAVWILAGFVVAVYTVTVLDILDLHFPVLFK